MLGDLNTRLMRKLGASRREFFDTIQAQHCWRCRQMPERRRCRVAPDYHVEVHGHFYSVPSRLIREVVEARITDTTIEIFRDQRVAAHPRSALKRRHTTTPEHMPSAHRRYYAGRQGGCCRLQLKSGRERKAGRDHHAHQTASRAQCSPGVPGHPAAGQDLWRSPLEAACQRGLTIGARTYGSVASILRTGLDRAFHDDVTPEAAPLLHANIRGRG